LKILYVSQYFPPEVGATQSRAHEMARRLVLAGHHVTVLTEFPNHPRGVVAPEHHGKWAERASLDGVEVLRVRVWTSPVKTFWSRLGFYLSFMFSAVLFGAFRTAGRFDVVYATSPPFFVGLAGWCLACMKRARFVMEVRDLWPASAVALGELRNRTLIRLSESLERFYYRHAATVVVVTAGIQENLRGRGVPPEKLALIVNGSNPDIFRDHGQELKTQLGLEGKFVVGYAGVFGIAQGLERLVPLAILAKEARDVHFLLIGAGPERSRAETLLAQARLENVSLLSERPATEIARYISAFDLHLVPLRKCPLFEGAMPTKMFDGMACERPILLGANGEARRALEAAEAGVAVDFDNPAAVWAAILELKASPERRRAMGRNGRAFVVKRFSRENGAAELERCLLDVCGFAAAPGGVPLRSGKLPAE